ncbi:MAG TPA: transcriptional regulator GcvA [Alphaproteobacteria bacterium]|nr:transcriptional regulator GcvA [Alphaproteobacteria bacterium]
MHRRLPPLNTLKAFEAAARLESFSKAAAELRVTHGAISRHVQILEEWLGAPMFERLNRRVRLTAAGDAYLAEIGAAFDRIALATARQLERGKSPLLRVNALSTFTMRWLIPRLSAFQMAHPHIEVRLTTSNERIAKLVEPFDVVIRGGPAQVTGYVGHPFLPEARIPVCSPSLRRRIPLEQPRDLRRHTLLHTSTLPKVWPQWLQAAGVPDLAPRQSLMLEHFYLTLQGALDGLGVAMGPISLVTEDVARGRLEMPFAAPILPAPSYYAYVPEARRGDHAVAAFIRWLEQAGQAAPALPEGGLPASGGEAKKTARRRRAAAA